MRSGYPYSQPGDPGYPALEHQSDVGTLTSPQDNNVAPEPVLHPANGIPNNKVATHYPGELRVAHSPAQWQQGNTQSQRNFQGLPQLESQPSMACTGFQHSKPRESACSPQTSHYGINRKANAHFSSSAHASPQHSSYFATSANENSVRQSVRNGRQQNECFKRKGTDLNINSGLLHKRLCAASSVSTSSAALQGGSLGVTTQESPLQDQCSVPDSKQKSCPLLRTLLKGNSPDFFFTRPSSSSKETNANIELTTSTHFSDEMHLKSLQVKSSLAALNCGKSRTQNLDHLGGTHSTECQQQVSSCSSSSQPSMDKVSPVGERVPCADDQIQHFIAKTTAYIKSILVLKNANDKDSTLQSDYVTPKSNNVAHLPTTSAHNKEDVDIQRLIFAVIEQASAAVGQALEEDSLKDSKANAVLTPKSKEMGDCATSGSKKHSTGTLAPAVGNLKHVPKTESVENSTLADFDLSVKKHLDVTMPTNGDGKLASGGYEGKTFESSNAESFHSKSCDKYIQNGVTSLHYLLTALKELIASLENAGTIVELDNFPKVILQEY